jgi:hypothetical protein
MIGGGQAYGGQAYGGDIYGGQAINGGVMQGGVMQGRAMQGRAMQGRVMQGRTVLQGSGLGIADGSAYAPIQGATNYSYGSVAPSYSVPSYSAAPVYSAPAYAGPVYSAPVAAPSSFGIAAAAIGGGRSVNRVVGVRGLAFNRNFENNRFLTRNPSGSELFSNTADISTMAGLETFLISRNANGGGWEARYWGLYPNEADVTLAGTSFSTGLTGLQWLTHGPSGATVQDIYNAATTSRIYRNNRFNNVEFNLLRNGGCFRNRRGKQVNFELLGGVRWFQFDETFRFSAFGATAGYPTDMNYELDVRNTLLGLQTGARTETCLTNKLRLAATAKVGLFNNNSSVRQAMFDENGINPTINNGTYAGTPYSFESEDNNFAMLGELDLGLIYQLTGNSRLNFGYRGLGITGLALAPNQIPYDFQDVREINQINNDGSLILHGIYGGLEWCH